MSKEKVEKEFNITDYYTPLANGVLVKQIKLVQGEVSGLIIAEGQKGLKTYYDGFEPPEETGTFKDVEAQSLGMSVVAIGPEVKRVKPGDYIQIAPSTQVISMEMFGEKYFYVSDYAILGIFAPNADQVDSYMREKKRKEKQKSVIMGLNEFKSKQKQGLVN